MTATTERAIKSRLYNVNALCAQDDVEEKLKKCRKVLEDLTKDTSEKQAHDALSAAVAKSTQLHEEVCFGLLHVILTEPNLAQNAYRDLNLVSRDSMVLVVGKLLQLISEKYIRLNDSTKSQLIWLTAQFVQANISGADAVCHALLKQMAGGDLSNTNIWLVESLLNMFSNNRQWLEKFSWLMAAAVFTYLRLIEDHSAGTYKNLRQKEVNFCVSVLRERFNDCMQVGRDLVRVLQNVAKIPEMKSLWKDLLHKPQTLSPQFTGISQLLSVRTSRKFLATRLTPDMENKIGFLTSKVKFGQQKRYQEWFQKQYLTSPESQSLRADLVRYICGVVHPSNEILGSDITPRWAVIGWLLSTCPNNVTAANSKLALFYDWLFYQADSDNIMNIEPGILVMFHSLRSHFLITTSLLDFLCRVSLEYYQQGQSSRDSVRNAFKTVLEKKVIMSLVPILEDPRMGLELKNLVRASFPELCHANGSSGKVPEDATSPVGRLDSFGGNGIPSSVLNFGGPDGLSDSDSAEGFNDAKFSDTDEEMDAQVNGEKANVKLKESKFQVQAREEKDEEELNDDEDLVDFDELEKLDEDLRDLVLKLQQESNMGARCDTMESIAALVVSLNDFDDEMNSALATCLNISLVEDCNRVCLPEKVTGRELEDSLESPLYTLFGKLIHLPTHDIGRESIVKLLQEMKTREPKLGYHLLYYLRASNQDEENLSVYEEFAKSTKDFKSILESLLEDMKMCQMYDPRLFVYLVPALYRKFSKALVGNSEMLHLMVSIVDPVQLKELLHEVVLRDLVIFGDGNIDSILEESLRWESYKQYNVWQLLCAEDPPIESFLNVIPQLKPSVHSEAMSNILLLLKGADFTSEVISSLLCMECPGPLKEKPEQLLSTCLLRYWSFDYNKELAKIICSHIEKNLSSGNRRRQLKGSSQRQPTMEQILVQLECFYELCQHHQDLTFFKQEIVKRSLEKVKQNCTDSVQQKFHHLFSICVEQESRRRNNRMSKIVATQLAEAESSSESEEEQERRQRTGKRKRKPSPDFASDSDD